MVSTTTDTMDQIDVQNHLSISERVWHYRLVQHARDTSSKWCCWEMKSHIKGHDEKFDSSQYSTKVIMEWSLKDGCHLLNWVPSKTVTKILYELWTGKSLSIKHLHVWVVQPKLGHIYHMRRSWTQGQLAVYSEGVLRGIKAISFIVPPLRTKKRIANFFKDI